MIELLQSRPATVDVVLRSDAPGNQPRAGLGHGDVVVQLKRAGSSDWVTKALSPDDWVDADNGAYVLALGPADVDTLGVLLVLVSGRPGLLTGIHPSLTQVEVVREKQFSAVRPNLPRTTLVGQIVGLDGRPIARATITATLLQVPVVLDGVAVAGDAIIASSDDHGFFELPVITGATVDVDIAAVRYRRTLIVPAPPVPGTPVRLFSIP
jgi:hypothetical protein